MKPYENWELCLIFPSAQLGACFMSCGRFILCFGLSVFGLGHRRGGTNKSFGTHSNARQMILQCRCQTHSYARRLTFCSGAESMIPWIKSSLNGWVFVYLCMQVFPSRILFFASPAAHVWSANEIQASQISHSSRQWLYVYGYGHVYVGLFVQCPNVGQSCSVTAEMAPWRRAIRKIHVQLKA